MAKKSHLACRYLAICALVLTPPRAEAQASPFPERVGYTGFAATEAGKPLEGRFDMVFRYFDADGGEELAMEVTDSVAVLGGRFEVKLGVNPFSDGPPKSVYESLQDLFAQHAIVQLEVTIGGVIQTPMVEIHPGGHSLESRLVLSGQAVANDGRPHWKRYRHRSVDSAVEAVQLRPAHSFVGPHRRGPLLVPMYGPLLSMPVRDLPLAPIRPPQADEGKEVNRPRHETLFDKEGRRFGTGIEQIDDPLAALSRNHFAPDANTPAPVMDFEGIGNLNGVLPADPEGAVGPNHYVQVVNLSFAIYDKSGTLILGPYNTNSLWAGTGDACETNNSGDAIVMYDQLADRWIISQFAVQTGQDVCFAVSQSPDPTGTFNLYRLAATRFPDYFKLGIWPDPTHNAFLMGTNTGFSGQYDIYAVDRASLLTGVVPRAAQLFQNHPNFLMPADIDGFSAPPNGAPGLFYSFRDGGESYFDPPSPVDTMDLYELSLDWVTPANSTFQLVQMITPTEGLTDFNWTVCGLFVVNCLPQPDTAQGIDSASWWPMQRLVYRNFGSHEAMIGTWTVDTDASGDHAAPRWFELRRSGGSWSLFQEGTHSPDLAHRWMPSIAMDGSGNIALGYSVVDAPTNLYPSIRYATRSPVDPLGTMQTEQTLTTGAGSQTHSGARWGDYSSMEIDPSDDCTFWYTTEYLHSTGSAPWTTRIGTFKLPECGGSTYYLWAGPDSHQICQGSDAVYNVTTQSIGGFTNPVNLSLTGHSGTPTFVPNPVVPAGTSVLTLTGAAAGSYPMLVHGSATDPADPTNTIDRTFAIGLDVLEPLIGAATLQQPPDTAIGVGAMPTFQWTAVADTVHYTLEVATDPGFITVVTTATVTGTSHTLVSALDDYTLHYWRVTAENPCGSLVSASFAFTTAGTRCVGYPSTDTPLPIPSGSPSGTTVSTIAVGDTGTITDVDVTLLGTYSWMAGLTFDLQSPGSTALTILDTSICGAVEDFDLTLDDDASSSFPCPPNDGGTYLPSNPLSLYQGETQAGAWTLMITDLDTGDSGSLTSWSLRICSDPTPQIDVSPLSVISAQLPDTSIQRTLHVGNLGEGALDWTITEDNTTQPVESLSSLPEATLEAIHPGLSASGPPDRDQAPATWMAPEGALTLALDDGNRENAIGATDGQQILWLNRFTPNPSFYPITLTEVQVLFPSGNGVNVGEAVDIFVWEDTDGDDDPGTGANHLASEVGVTVQAVDDSTFSQYVLSAPLVMNGPGDILIGVVNRTAGSDAGEHPAALDQSTSAARSWVGLYSGPPGTPPTLPADSAWDLIDNLAAAGNWMVRGIGSTAAGCSGVSDIPWLSLSPANGTTFPSDTTPVTVTFDSTGMADATYTGNLCLGSNDPFDPSITVPVSLTVDSNWEPPFFADGFESGNTSAWSSTVP